MKFTVEREHLLKPLQQVSGPLGGRPTLPILGNLLLQVADGTLSLTGTDLEMEIGFNVSYVLDVLNALKCENVRMMLTDSVSSVQIEDAASQSAAYVVMPMRL